MAIDIVIEMWCNGCGCEFRTDYMTAKQLREEAKGYGWINRGAKDFCKDCVEEKIHLDEEKQLIS